MEIPLWDDTESDLQRLAAADFNSSSRASPTGVVLQLVSPAQLESPSRGSPSRGSPAPASLPGALSGAPSKAGTEHRRSGSFLEAAREAGREGVHRGGEVCSQLWLGGRFGVREAARASAELGLWSVAAGASLGLALGAVHGVVWEASQVSYRFWYLSLKDPILDMLLVLICSDLPSTIGWHDAIKYPKSGKFMEI